MAKRTLRIQKPKDRRSWHINPSTRVVDSRKIYHRSVEKEKEREIVSENETRLKDAEGGRTLGIDYGQRRVGLALSDPLNITAQGIETIEYDDNAQLFSQLEDVINTYTVEKIVVGLPVGLNGTRGEKATEVMRFIDRIKKHFQIPVVTWDERMTTAAAHRTMHEMGCRAKGAKGKLDRIAATLILQGYLDSIPRGD